MENNTDLLSQVKKTYPDAFEVPAGAGYHNFSCVQLTDKVVAYMVGTGKNSRLLFKPNLPNRVRCYAHYMGYEKWNPAYKNTAPNNMTVWQGAAAKKWVERHSEAYDFIMDKFTEAKLEFDKKVRDIKGLVKYGMLVEGHPDFNEVGKITVQMTNGVYHIVWSLLSDELKADYKVTWEGDLSGLADINDFVPAHKPTWEALDLLGVIRLIEKSRLRLWFEVLKPSSLLSLGVCESAILDGCDYYDAPEAFRERVVEEMNRRKTWLESFDAILLPIG